MENKYFSITALIVLFVSALNWCGPNEDLVKVINVPPAEIDWQKVVQLVEQGADPNVKNN